ncbi:LLM class flavin-dependent oxidoreductase [Streptomyces sp. GLT-R25]
MRREPAEVEITMTTRDGTIGVLLPRDTPTRDIIPFARRAEEHGFDELWVVEDLGYRGGLVQAATVLASTTRIRVGVGLLPAAARNVAFTAMEIASLAQLHPDRLDIAVGHGMPSWMRSAGAWPKSPLTLLAEYITVLKSLLSGQLVDQHGKYVHIDGVRLHESSTPAAAPAVLAGVRGPKSLAVSGDVADGTLLAEPVTPAYVKEALKHIAPHPPPPSGRVQHRGDRRRSRRRTGSRPSRPRSGRRTGLAAPHRPAPLLRRPRRPALTV